MKYQITLSQFINQNMAQHYVSYVTNVIKSSLDSDKERMCIKAAQLTHAMLSFEHLVYGVRTVRLHLCKHKAYIV